LIRSRPLPLALGVYTIFAMQVLFMSSLLSIDPGGSINNLGAEEGDQIGLDEVVSFAVHTLGTVGYGAIVPDIESLYANFTVALLGFLGFIINAVISGILWAVVSKPPCLILMSHHALLAKEGDHWIISVRVVGLFPKQPIVSVKMCLACLIRFSLPNGDSIFRIFNLELEHQIFNMFHLPHTLRHKITPGSPLYELVVENGDLPMELHVHAEGFDTCLGKTVHETKRYFARKGNILGGYAFVPCVNFAHVLNKQQQQGATGSASRGGGGGGGIKHSRFTVDMANFHAVTRVHGRMASTQRLS